MVLIKIMIQIDLIDYGPQELDAKLIKINYNMYMTIQCKCLDLYQKS